MKTSLLRSLASIVVVGLVLCSSIIVLAGPASSGDLLRQAYVALAKADHDYKGHRIEAMIQVEAAGKLVGVNVRGDGKGHEKQGLSDEQLRAAKGLLEQASPGLSGKALQHVERAIKQIAVALKLK